MSPINMDNKPVEMKIKIKNLIQRLGIGKEKIKIKENNVMRIPIES